MKYLTSFATRETPQTEPIPGSGQVPNDAGGYGWAVDDWVRLDRFLILGSEGGTYYVQERELTRQNAEAVLRCIQRDGPRAVARIVEVSESGRAPKNDPALFALAMASALGDQETRQAALEALPRVARTGTHLFHFCQFRQQFGGWGRAMKRTVARWYNGQEADQLAYQVIKYRQRDGWSHRDVLRKAHPVPPSPAHQALYRWITQGDGSEHLPSQAVAFAAAQRAQQKGEIVRLITDYALPREAIPPEWLREPEVWDALLQRMPLTAMIRNLGTMGSVGLLKPMSEAAATVVGRLQDGEALRRARVHPLQVLAALHTYGRGQGVRGGLTWAPVPQVVDALDEAFYAAFQNVEPTGKRLLLALDVSGSMAAGEIAGVGGITPAVGAAAMALITARTEDRWAVMAFAREFRELPISPRERLDDVLRRTTNVSFGGTDCALPMLYAEKRGLAVDAFIVYTDSQTWAGQIHPVQALWRYRQRSGIPAKLVVVGMVSNGFTIADPGDAGMLDVVGFDTAAPGVISDFVRT